MIYMEGLKENYIFIAALLQVMPCVGSGISLDKEQWCLSNFCLVLCHSERFMSQGLVPSQEIKNGGKSVVKHFF